MEDTPFRRASLIRWRSASGAFRAGDIRTRSYAQSFYDDEDDGDRNSIKRMTSSQTLFEHPVTEHHSVRKRSLGQRISCVSTAPAQYNPHQESSMLNPLRAQSRLSHASNTGGSTLDPEIESTRGQTSQASQGSGQAVGGRKRSLLKTAMRSLLGQKPNSEIPLGKPVLGVNFSRPRNGPSEVGNSSMATVPSATLRRSISTPMLRHDSRPGLELHSPTGSLDSVPQRKRVKPVPSTPQLRSTLLESVFEAPNESAARPAASPPHSASLNDRQSTLSSRTRQIRPPVNRDYKLKRPSASIDPLFQVTEAYNGGLQQRRNADREFGERRYTETDVLGPLEAIEEPASEELVQNGRLLSDRSAHYPTRSDSIVGPSLSNDDTTQLEERVASWEVSLQSLERKLSASGQSLITAEDISWTAINDQSSSYASGTFEPDCHGGTAGKHHPARSLSSSQHESSATIDHFLILVNLINHERAARKALQSRLQELKTEVAELRSRSSPTHPLRMHPVTPLPQAPPSPPPASPDFRLSASFSGLIKQRLEKATRFPPSCPDSPTSMHTPQIGRENGRTDLSDRTSTGDGEKLMAHKNTEDFGKGRVLEHVIAPQRPSTYTVSSAATGSARASAPEHLVQPTGNQHDALECMPATTYVPHHTSQP